MSASKSVTTLHPSKEGLPRNLPPGPLTALLVSFGNLLEPPLCYEFRFIYCEIVIKFHFYRFSLFNQYIFLSAKIVSVSGNQDRLSHEINRN